MDLPEVWLRGPVENIPALMQPIAHALLQSGEEIEKLMIGFPKDKLWLKPSGVASVGFHLQHLVGVIDRLFTYARGESLSPDQLQALRTEGTAPSSDITVQELVQRFHDQVKKALNQLQHTN